MLLKIDGGELAYDYLNLNIKQPPLLFLHGALGVRGQFDALRAHFPDRSQLAVDFPSHGESSITHGDANVERLARDVLALLDALGIERADIVGHSMGGYAGMVMAHLAPQRVGSVVTLGTKFYWTREVIGQTQGELDASLLRTRSQRFYDALAASHTASGADQTLGFAQALIGDFGRWQLSEEMVRAANVPLMICAGDRDTLVPVDEVMKLFAALDPKRSAVAILPGTPHPLQQLPAAAFGAQLRRFWEFTAAKKQG